MSAESVVSRVRRSFGDPAPDWLEALARACDETSQTEVAIRLGYSRTAVSLLVNGNYDRDLTDIEQAVRERLMGAVIVTCPVRGNITSSNCRSNQALPYSNANHQRVALYRACRSCSHSSLAGASRAEVRRG